MALLGEISASVVKRGGDAGTSLQQLMGEGDLPRGKRESHAAKAPAASPKERRVTSLSIIVPAKNEAAGLPALLASLARVLASVEGLETEVLVIDDGSTDATPRIARDLGARVVTHAESLGNGAAVKRGIRESRHRWILLLDGDGQHPPEEIPRLLEQAERYDMVVGSRNGGGGSVHRNLANKTYNALASYVANRPIPDLTSGFRVLRADLAKGFAYLLPNTFSYPSTLTLSLFRAGYSVGFVDVKVRPRQGKSHIRIVRDGCRFLLIIMRIATFFAPLRVFMPLSLGMAGLGIVWYLVTLLTAGRFTNMSALLLTQATVIFVLGLVSEQIAAMRFERGEGRS